MVALRTRKRETTQIEFREVKASRVFIAEREASHKDSMDLLQQNGLRPLTYREALIKMDQSPELKQKLKGKWFYLEGKGKSAEETVHVWKGPYPLFLFVHPDKDADRYGRWFSLGGGYWLQIVARVVVGVRIGHEVGTPKIAVSKAPKGILIKGVSLEEFEGMLRDADVSRLLKAAVKERALTNFT